VWEALNFGQVMYAIKTRNAGKVYLQFERKYGDMSALEAEELSDAERRFKAERGGGNYGAGTKEMQAANYAKAKALEAERVALFEGALKKYNAGAHSDALVDFENVLAMEPPNYLGDNFARVTTVYRATQYNIACCYAAVGQADAGLEALDGALRAGYDNYSKVRSDPNLAGLRVDKKAFDAVIDKYDEPILNTEAIAFLKRLNPFARKDEDE
jgi:tetratricopeptide (TPR) repeat protein